MTKNPSQLTPAEKVQRRIEYGNKVNNKNLSILSELRTSDYKVYEKEESFSHENPLKDVNFKNIYQKTTEFERENPMKKQEPNIYRSPKSVAELSPFFSEVDSSIKTPSAGATVKPKNNLMER